MKKLRKQMDSHQKRHEKWKDKNKRQEFDEENQDSKKNEDECVTVQQSGDRWTVLDPSFCHVVAGSFGKRQGLNLRSDMGPFCHVLQV